MNLFKKLRKEFEHQIFRLELYDDAKNFDQVLLEKRIEILKEIATPKFAQIGLQHWDGKYLWYSDFNEEGIKHTVRFDILKFGGVFTFGNCFYSVPTISGKKLINHRTEKSTKVIYHKRSEGWQKCIDNNSSINRDLMSVAYEKKFRKSLEKVINQNLPKFEHWFKSNDTIEKNISSLKKDVKNPPNEFLVKRAISYEYILAFLYQQLSQQETAEFWINEHFKKSLNTELEMELLLKRIKNS